MTARAAEERGFWKRYGLETKWFSMKGGSPTFQALAAGLTLTGLGSFSLAQRKSRVDIGVGGGR